MKEMENKPVGNEAEDNKIRETADAVQKSILDETDAPESGADAASKLSGTGNEPDRAADGRKSGDEAKKPNKKEGGSGKGFRASFSSRKFKGGAYATLLSVIVVAVVLLVNLIVGKLDLKIDVTTQEQYTISDQTKELMKGLQDDITIYYLVQPGGEQELFTKLVDKYEGLSSHIKVEYKDPVQYPKFASKYTSETIAQNSIIVVNDATERAKYIDYNDMLVTEINYQTYQTQVTGTDVEGQITSAIQYVTNEDLPVVYEVTGHGETAVGSSLSSALAKENVTLSSINTLTEETIPEDCDILLINGPTQDFMEEEVTMIKEYLANGGNAIIFTGYGSDKLTNFASLLSYYNVGITSGLVVEGSTSNFMGQYPSMLVPNVESHAITSAFRGQKYVVASNSAGLQILDGGRTTVTAAPLLKTSDSAYSKTGEELATVSKEDGDIDGPFYVGLYVTEEYNGVETKLAVFGTPNLIADSMISTDTLGNADLFLNTINNITEQENTLSIRTVSLAMDTITMTASQVNLWSAIDVVIIPAIIIIIGIVVTVRRRKK